MNDETRANSTPVTDHFDTYLGEIKEGWRTPPRDGQSDSGFALAQFSLAPWEGWSILGTYGLSREVLRQGEDNELRQELLLCWQDEEIADSLLSHLNAVAQTVQQTGEVIGRGALLAIPPQPVLTSGDEDRPWAAWYVTMPFFLPESGILMDSIDPPIVFTWLFPVYADEAEFIELEGADAFDQLILDNRELCFEYPRPSLVEE